VCNILCGATVTTLALPSHDLALPSHWQKEGLAVFFAKSSFRGRVAQNDAPRDSTESGARLFKEIAIDETKARALVTISWPSNGSTSGFGDGLHSLDFRRFRILSIGNGFEAVNADPLL
jgi:hypothetical protein